MHVSTENIIRKSRHSYAVYIEKVDRSSSTQTPAFFGRTR